MGTPGQQLRHVAVVVYPGCTIAETVEVATRLRSNGYRVTYVASTGDPFPDASGLVLCADREVANLAPEQVDAVMVPGGDPAAVIGDTAVQELLRGAYDAGAIVAAICAGVVVVADAGLTVGRQITHNYRSPWAPASVAEFVADFWRGAQVHDDRQVGVVVDDRLITALPNATAEFSATICRELGVYDDATASLVARHLRGEFVPDLYG